MTRLELALQFAIEAHGSQRDKAGQPYINHPIAVAESIQEKYKDGYWPYREFTLEDLIVAALLHDVVEDTNVTLDLVELEFGLPVRIIVDGVTRRKPLGETYQTFVKRAKQHPGSRLLKLADIYHNLSRIDSLPSEEQGIRKRYELAVRELNRD